VPISHGISRKHYVMHATQLFIDRSGVPHAHVECVLSSSWLLNIKRIVTLKYKQRKTSKASSENNLEV